MVWATFNGSDYAEAKVKQWDYGQQLVIQGLKLPTSVEVHFAVCGSSDPAKVRVGTTADGITTAPIPDGVLEQPKDIMAYIYLTDENSGKTVYTIRIKNSPRAKPEIQNKPEEAELFREAIAAVNAAADRAEAAVSTEHISDIVNEYLKENPIQGGATKEQAEQIKKNKEDIDELKDDFNNLREQIESGSVGGGSVTSSEVKTILQRIQTEIKACIRDDSVCPNTYIDATDNLINNLGIGSSEPVDPNPPIEEPDVPTPSNKYRATIIDPVPLTYEDRSNYTNFDWKTINGGGKFAFKEKTFTGTVYIRCFLASRYISGDYMPRIYTNDSETVSYTNLVKLDISKYFGNGTVVTPYGLDADGNITDAPVNGFMYIAKYEIPSGKYGVLIFNINNGNSAFKQGAKGTTAVFYSDITSDVTTMDIEEV